MFWLFFKENRVLLRHWQKFSIFIHTNDYGREEDEGEMFVIWFRKKIFSLISFYVLWWLWWWVESSWEIIKNCFILFLLSLRLFHIFFPRLLRFLLKRLFYYRRRRETNEYCNFIIVAIMRVNKFFVCCIIYKLQLHLAFPFFSLKNLIDFHDLKTFDDKFHSFDVICNRNVSLFVWLR